MSLDLDAIKARADQYAAAMSRGYSANTLAGQFLDDVLALVAEVERLRARLEAEQRAYQEDMREAGRELREMQAEIDAARWSS